jgi:hypothetical protein
MSRSFKKNNKEQKQQQHKTGYSEQRKLKQQQRQGD